MDWIAGGVCFIEDISLNAFASSNTHHQTLATVENPPLKLFVFHNGICLQFYWDIPTKFFCSFYFVELYIRRFSLNWDTGLHQFLLSYASHPRNNYILFDWGEITAVWRDTDIERQILKKKQKAYRKYAYSCSDFQFNMQNPLFADNCCVFS